MTAQNAFLAKYASKRQDEIQKNKAFNNEIQKLGEILPEFIEGLPFTYGFLELYWNHKILPDSNKVLRELLLHFIATNEERAEINEIKELCENLNLSHHELTEKDRIWHIQAIKSILDNSDHLVLHQLMMDIELLPVYSDISDNITYEELAEKSASYLRSKAAENNYTILPEVFIDNHALWAISIYGAFCMFKYNNIINVKLLLRLFITIYGLIQCEPFINKDSQENPHIILVDILFKESFNDLNERLKLGIDITLDDFINMSDDEMFGLNNLWENIIESRIQDEGSSIILQEDMNASDILTQFHKYYKVRNTSENDEEDEIEEYQELQADNKASVAILKFFDSNSNTLVAKLKESGLQLSAAALQNDQNIARVANVVYNLLPGMVRIFVSYDTVENFLLNNRQWLINKLV